MFNTVTPGASVVACCTPGELRLKFQFIPHWPGTCASPLQFINESHPLVPLSVPLPLFPPLSLLLLPLFPSTTNVTLPYRENDPPSSESRITIVFSAQGLRHASLMNHVPLTSVPPTLYVIGNKNHGHRDLVEVGMLEYFS